MKKNILALTLLAVFVSAPALAETTPAQSPAMVKVPGDTDGDSRVSKDEFLAMYTKIFEQRDLDGNGYIDMNEKTAFEERQAELRRQREARAEAAPEAIAPEAGGEILTEEQPAEKKGFFSRFFKKD